MAHTRNYTMPLRRKREGKTNFKKRLKLLLSRKPRLVVRRSVKGTIVQIVQYAEDGDKILVEAKSTELSKYGLKTVNGNVPTAYLTGLLIAKKAEKIKEEGIIVDFGVRYLTPKSRLFAVVKGAIDGGLSINASDDFFPEDERVEGKLIEQLAVKLKDDKEAYAKQFSEYVKQGIKPEEISKVFAQVKQKIMG